MYREKYTILRALALCGATALALLTLVNCGHETTGDQIARAETVERNRQQHLKEQNDIIEGVYQGSTPTGDVFLSVQSSQVSANSQIAQTTLVGTLVLAPYLESELGRIRLSYPFYDGVYNRYGGDKQHALGKFAFNVEKDTTPSTVTCLIDGNRQMICKWNATGNFSFALTPSSELTLSALDLRKDSRYMYQGEAQFQDFEGEMITEIITMQFENGSTKPDSSQVARPTILGTIQFKDKANGSVHVSQISLGTYNHMEGSLNLKTNDQNGGFLNCFILKSGGALDCSWHSGVYYKFIAKRILKTKL